MAASTSSQPARTVAVANQKGGVGKSTSTINLARAGHLDGLRVLVVDADSQGNVTSDLAFNGVKSDDLTLADVLVGDATLDEVIVPTIWDRVSLAPAGATLATAVDHLTTALARETKLRAALASRVSEFDLILIDCPPALGLATVNALTAADSVLLVAEPDRWSADALADIAVTIGDVRAALNPALRVAGVLLNRVRKTAEAEAVTAEMAEHVGAHLDGAEVWVDRAVPLLVAISTHTHNGTGLDQGTPRLRALMDDVYLPTVRELVGGDA